jgi:hypothetical protein
MAKPSEDEGKFGTVVKELGEVKSYQFRVLVLPNKKRVLDIRQYIDTNDFKGFTKRGIRLTGEDLSDTIELLEEAKELLDA